MSVSDRQEDCLRFDSLLAEYLEGDLPSSEMTWMARHRDTCTRCMDALQAAAEVEEALASWSVPAPPSHLRERILRLIRRSAAPHQILCSDLRGDLDAWLSGDLSVERAETLARHVEICAPCAHQATIAQGVEKLLSNWKAPLPRAGFADRVLAAIDADQPAPGEERRPEAAARPAHAPVAVPAPRRRLVLGRSALAAAAALLIVAYLGLRDHSQPQRVKIPQESPVNELLDQHARDVRLRAVSTEQFPAGIGSFDAQPLVLDRGRRQSGNAFHRSLRKALVSSAVSMDR